MSEPAGTNIRPDATASPIRSRVALAAAHIVPGPWAENVPGAPADIDWESTLGFRHHLWSLGLGVAEAMDTAQRGMGLNWSAAQELIVRSTREAAAVGGRIAAGAGTDHMPEAPTGLDDVLRAYEEQLSFVEGTGAQPVLMASRLLARSARGPEDYLEVYARLLTQCREPVILHWLGSMFDPALTGYWGAEDFDSACQTVLTLITDQPGKVDGIKLSLLEPRWEQHLRARLPTGVRMYTGDDFHYPELILGDGRNHSDALLGIFAAIAPAASRGLRALDSGDVAAYNDALMPTVPLARHLFCAPTQYYKTGIAFLAWLSGHQPGFAMVAGLQSGRSLVHLLRAKELADQARVFPDPDLATYRMNLLLQMSGVGS